MKKVIYMVIAVVVAVIFMVAFFKRADNNPKDKNGVVCTMEAKLCPDGSYVGRVGPLCEFSACPSGTKSDDGDQSGANVSLTTKINQPAIGMGVSVTPLEVIEDSRCPTDVVCVWAGTVRLRATIANTAGTKTEVFNLGTPINTAADKIELVEVLPEARSEIAIRASEYRFKFKISKRFPMEI